jgi:hypothetical protein
VVVLAVAAALLVAVAAVASRAVDASRAQAAADAAALAGATGGPVAARRVAAANNAVLVSMQRVGADVVVVVEVRGVRGVARASTGRTTRRDPTQPPVQ